MINFVSSHSKVYHVQGLVMAVFCALAVSCDLPPGAGGDKGTLTITLPGTTVPAQNLALGRAVHLPEPITNNMSYTVDFYRSSVLKSTISTRERVVYVTLEPGYWDIVVTALYGSAMTTAAIDKKPQVEVLAGQTSAIYFTMNADEFMTPARVPGPSQDKSITTGTPTSLAITMNTSTPFTGTSGWTDSFSYQWYYVTGSGNGTRTNVASGSGSFSGPGSKSISRTITHSTTGIFRYFVEIGNSYTYAGGTPTTIKNSVFVGNITVTPGMPYSVGSPGPGGGIVFYVDAVGFYSNGVLCHYLEFSPTYGSAAWGADGYTVAGTGTAIGTGYDNTQAIILVLSGIPETGRAAQLAAGYTGGGQTDWFLPSFDELQALYASGISGLTGSVFSSTQDTATHAWSVGNAGPPGYWSDSKSGTGSYYPVRAFP
jgi:hypothetical protein